MSEFQYVRLSPRHPAVHLASTVIAEENKTDSRATWCGAGLGPESLLNLSEPVTCGLCLRKLRRLARGWS